MAQEDDIVQRISLLGSDEIRKELEALGKDGEEALNRLSKAGNGDLAAGVRKLIPEVQAFEKSMAGAVDTTSKLPGIFGRIGQAMKQLQGINFGQAFEKDATAAAAASGNFAQQLRQTGREVRALGRAIDIPGISQLGRSFTLVSRNIALIAFPAVIAALGSVADSAATATVHVLDLSAALQKTPQDFARAASVVIALGGSIDDASKTFQTFEKNVATATASTNSAAEAIANAREALEGARDGATDAVRAFAPLKQAQYQNALAAASGKTTLEAYNAQLVKLGEQWDTTSRAFNKAEDAVDKAQKALDKARAATTPLEDAFRKVGVTLNDSFGKLKLEEQLKRVAPGFANLGKEVDKVKIAVQLFGDEMGRKMVDALSGGVKGVDEFIARGEKIRPALLAQSKQADDFVKTLGQLEQAIASVKDAFGIALAPAFTDFFKQLIELIIQNREGFAEFGKVLATIVTPFLQGFLVILKAVGAVITLIAPLFTLAANAINKLFGSNLSGGQVFLAIVVGLAAAFAPMIPLIVLAGVAVAKFVEELNKINFKPIIQSANAIWTGLVTGFNTVVDAVVGFFVDGAQLITDAWNGVADFFKGIWDGIVSGAVGIWTAITGVFNAGAKLIVDSFNGAIQFVKDAFNGFLSYIQSWVQSGINFIQGLVDKIKELINAITGVNKAQSGDQTNTQQAYAGGGEVRGRGTGTSDSILAAVSNGEFVTRTAAVSHYGTRMMHAINNMTFPKIPGFSMGGLVDALAPMRAVPRFAEGGSVGATGARSTFTLQIGGESFTQLTAPEHTADRMIKFATAKAVRRGGARPSWYGAGK